MKPLRLNPMPMTKQQLVDVLTDILQRVQEGDSWEGSIEYMMPGEPSEDVDFMVKATYRTGNSMGQGGMRMLGPLLEDEFETVQVRTRYPEHYVLVNENDGTRWRIEHGSWTRVES